MNYIKQKHLPYGRQVQERLSANNPPDPFKSPSLFFISCTEIHIFSGDTEGWNRAKCWNNANYLALVMPENERPERYKFPVSGCFVFVHLSLINKFITALVGEIVASGAIGYQLLLYSTTLDTPNNQITNIAGESCQKSTAVLYPEYYQRKIK